MTGAYAISVQCDDRLLSVPRICEVDVCSVKGRFTNTSKFLYREQLAVRL